ncbi:TatD family hydrolase [Arthrobacter sp. TB 23]|uniref:TatD family hydrolase n=1 Tax=Arthrobacter sp. TB 23 TaxID=494419 RepID=UPI00035C4A71|nr:TatD family hydrolase [Arthrobacter sp. TB 23]
MTADHLGLPSLDCHAHVAPDVTRSQLATLGNTHIFAMTRSLSEAALVADRADRHLTWGIGVHPGVPTARKGYDPDTFRRLLPQFALVGEVGLDKRGPREEQERILIDILDACVDQPVFISVHSTGRTSEVVDLIERHPHSGMILHWFLGTAEEVARAVTVGAYFSVNNAMNEDLVAAMPRDRILPETDFPAKQVRAEVPGATIAIEHHLGRIWRTSQDAARHQLWANLKKLAIDSGSIDVISDSLADTLLTV